jgi:hypothetical protein
MLSPTLKPFRKPRARLRVADAPAPTPPPPPPPPGLPHVVSTNFSGNSVTMTFDQPVECVSPGPPSDGAVTVNGMTPNYAANADAYTISMAFDAFVNAGEPWAIAYQPGWVVTAIEVPEAGVL